MKKAKPATVAEQMDEAELLASIEEFHRHVPGAIVELEELLAVGSSEMSTEDADEIRTVVQVLKVMQMSKMMIEAEGQTIH